MFHKQISLFSTIKYSVNQYSTNLPDFILENFNNCNGDDSEKNQIIKALELNKQSFSFQEDELNDKLLKKIVKKTNSSVAHYSGNCSLLSACLLFNLKNGQNILAAKNTMPFYEGVSADVSDQIIFGENLIRSNKTLTTVFELEEEIVNIFLTTGERYFRISSEGYVLPLLGESGHDLNAIVRGSGTSVTVTYLDAWKTSNVLSSAQELQERYKTAVFAVEYYLGPLPAFVKGLQNNI